MSPEEEFAETMELARSYFLVIRDGATGPELFVRANRLDYVIPLSTGQIALLAEYSVRHLAKEARRAAAPQSDVA